MSANSFNIPRHWWGKIIGGVIGLFRGGIVGAVVGAILGHLVDRFLAGILNVGKTQKAFFDALFASLGALAKADGQVTQAEIQMVESLMQQMRISGDDRQRLRVERARVHRPDGTTRETRAYHAGRSR